MCLNKHYHADGVVGLTSLRMGPNPEDIYPHMSPLGFPKLPTFLGALINLQQLDISMAGENNTIEGSMHASATCDSSTGVKQLPIAVGHTSSNTASLRQHQQISVYSTALVRKKRIDYF